LKHQQRYQRFLPIPSDCSDAEYLRAALANAADAMAVDPIGFTANTTDSMGETALHAACTWGDPRAVRLLVEAGAEVDKLGEMKCTPLYLAIMLGRSDIAEYLVRRGANADIRSDFGDTPRERAQANGMSINFANERER
jgi:ankyrin repeat protein